MYNEEQELEQIERSSKLKKYFSIAIVALLISGLVGFGVSDFINSGSGYVIQVGSKKMTPEGFNRFADANKREYITRFGSGIIEGLLNKPEFANILVNLAVDQLLIESILEDNGIIIDKSAVNEYILKSPTFQDFNGNFDKTFYQNYINQMGMEEESFLIQTANTLKVKIFNQLIALNNITDISSLAKKQLMEEKQTRVITTYSIPVITKDVAASEEELLNFYNKNKNSFINTESRLVAMAKIDSSLLASTPIPEETLKQIYNKEYLYKGQKIDFYKLSFRSEQMANEARQMLASGASFTEVANTLLDLKEEDILFTQVPFADIIEGFESEISKLSIGQHSPVFFAGESYNIVSLTNFTKHKVPSFESVKQQITKNLKTANSCNDVIQFAGVIGAELDSGAPLEEALIQQSVIQNIWVDGKNQSIPEGIQTL